MLSTILIIILILCLLGGVGFWPANDFTPQARGVVGGVIFVAAIVWLVKYSHLF